MIGDLCCVLSFDRVVFMCRKAGLAVDRSWSLSGYWPRKCDRPKGHNLFVSLDAR